jgi:hypothetical protein
VLNISIGSFFLTEISLINSQHNADCFIISVGIKTDLNARVLKVNTVINTRNHQLTLT